MPVAMLSQGAHLHAPRSGPPGTGTASPGGQGELGPKSMLGVQQLQPELSALEVERALFKGANNKRATYDGMNPQVGVVGQQEGVCELQVVGCRVPGKVHETQRAYC